MSLKSRHLLFAFLYWTFGVAFAIGQSERLADRVIVVVNQDEAESVKLGRYYAQKRGIPSANIIALPMPTGETVGWRVFVDSVYQPLQDELIRKGWIEAIGSSLRDSVGRKRYAISKHRISYLVLCRGVPLKVGHDAELYEAVSPKPREQELRLNSGSVDGELACIALSGYPINGIVPNRLFRKSRPTHFDEQQVVKVARLDGPTFADATALVDNALEAEARGLIGRAYVDIGGPHPQGDAWLEETVRALQPLGMDLVVDRKPEVFPASARFDAPALYFGWYAGTIGGPFDQPGFRFPPGAIALHIHSYSAGTLRSVQESWTGPLIARGVTATFGNVHEPYLGFTHHPHLIVKALVQGKTLGDAAAIALPGLSWQATLIGDPLYRPFAVPPAQQWEQRSRVPDALFPHLVSRMARLSSLGDKARARELALEAWQERPSWELALFLAQLHSDSDDSVEALRVLEAPVLNALPRPSAPIAAAAAELLSKHGGELRASQMLRAMLADDALWPEYRKLLLPLAIQAAEKTGAKDDAAAWALELATPPTK